MLKKMLNLFGISKTDNQLIDYLNSGALLVDVREEYEFKMGTAKGAVNIPLSILSNKIDFFKNQEKIVLFCRSGNRSGQALNVLKNLGINNIINGGSLDAIIAAQKSLNKAQ